MKMGDYTKMRAGDPFRIQDPDEPEAIVSFMMEDDSPSYLITWKQKQDGKVLLPSWTHHLFVQYFYQELLNDYQLKILDNVQTTLKTL